MATVRRLAEALNRFERSLVSLILGRRYPQDGLCVAGVNIDPSPHQNSTRKTRSISDIIGDGFLWAVPKHRRTIEKIEKRRFGIPYYFNKLLVPKKNLRVCNVCGDDHEKGVLCPTCYKKVIEETKHMQDKIQEKLKLDAVEEEVVVLYSGEKDEKPAEFWKGKRIVEMEKPRPNWFSRNLLQQTTQQPATTSDVKPSQLG